VFCVRHKLRSKKNCLFISKNRKLSTVNLLVRYGADVESFAEAVEKYKFFPIFINVNLETIKDLFFSEVLGTFNVHITTPKSFPLSRVGTPVTCTNLLLYSRTGHFQPELSVKRKD
jgi:hypothetical protein